MSIINLFWHLNISDTTKYMLIFGLIFCLLSYCFFSGTKGKKKDNKKKKSKTKN